MRLVLNGRMIQHNLTLFSSGVRKDGSGQLQTSLTDLKPPAAPNHSKRIADIHGKFK